MVIQIISQEALKKIVQKHQNNIEINAENKKYDIKRKENAKTRKKSS